MSDKIAAIRREVEQRVWIPTTQGARLDLATKAMRGVVIYGVPLNEVEILALCGAVRSLKHLDLGLRAIWEMLERGRQSQQEGLQPGISLNKEQK